MIEKIQITALIMLAVFWFMIWIFSEVDGFRVKAALVSCLILSGAVVTVTAIIRVWI